MKKLVLFLSFLLLYALPVHGRIGTPIISGGVETVTGGIFIVDLTSSEILSGASLFNAAIGNTGAGSEVTGTLASPSGGENIVLQLRSGDTPFSIKLTSGDSIYGIPTFNATLDYFYFSGSIMEDQMTLISTGASTWSLSGVSGSPDIKQF